LSSLRRPTFAAKHAKVSVPNTDEVGVNVTASDRRRRHLLVDSTPRQRLVAKHLCLLKPPCRSNTDKRWLLISTGTHDHPTPPLAGIQLPLA
jgi:hypothetical protein